MAVEIDGREVVAEPVEITEAFPCPLCEQIRGMGHARGRVCWRCRGRGVIGDELPLRAVLVDHDGGEVARMFEGEREPGETLHRLHSCP